MTHSSTSRVVLLCHGSSDPLWAEPFVALTASLQKVYGSQYVHLAFLERSEPNLATLVEELASLGPAHIRVLPVFLSSGKHLRQDVPPQLDAFAEKYAQLSFELLKPVGLQDSFFKMLEKLVAEALG